MYSPGRVELFAGILLMIPGVITAVLLEDVPMRALVDPGVIAAGIVGTIWAGELLPLVVSLLYVLYFAGAVAALVTLVNLARANNG